MQGDGLGLAMVDAWDALGCEPQMPFEMAVRSSTVQLVTLNESLQQSLDAKHTDGITKTLSEDLRRKCGNLTWAELSTKLALLMWEQAGTCGDEFNRAQWEEVKSRASFLAGKLREMQDSFPSDHRLFRTTFCALLNAYALMHGMLWSPACSRCCVAAEWWIWGMVFCQSNKHNLDRLLTRLQLHALYLNSEMLPEPGRYFKAPQPDVGTVDSQNCLLSTMPMTVEAVVGDQRLYLSISTAPISGASSLVASTPTVPSPSEIKSLTYPEPAQPEPSSFSSAVAGLASAPSKLVEGASAVLPLGVGSKAAALVAAAEQKLPELESKATEVQSKVAAALPPQVKSTLAIAAELPAKASAMAAEAQARVAAATALPSTIASKATELQSNIMTSVESAVKAALPQELAAKASAVASEVQTKAAEAARTLVKAAESEEALPAALSQVKSDLGALPSNVSAKLSELQAQAGAQFQSAAAAGKSSLHSVAAKPSEILSKGKSTLAATVPSDMQAKAAQVVDDKITSVQSRIQALEANSGAPAASPTTRVAPRAPAPRDMAPAMAMVSTALSSAVAAALATVAPAAPPATQLAPPPGAPRPPGPAAAPRPPQPAVPRPAPAAPAPGPPQPVAAKAASKPSVAVTTEMTMGGERCFVTLPETPKVGIPSAPDVLQYADSSAVIRIPTTSSDFPRQDVGTGTIDLPAMPLAVFPTAERSHCLAIVPYQEQRYCVALVPSVPSGDPSGRPFLAVVPSEDLRHCLAVIPGSSSLPEQRRCMALIPYQGKKDSCLALIPASHGMPPPSAGSSNKSQQLAIIPYDEDKLECLAVVPTAPAEAMARSGSAQDVLATIPAPLSHHQRRLAMIPYNERMNCLALTMPGAPLDLSRQCMALIPTLPDGLQAKLEDQQHRKDSCLAIFPAQSLLDASESCLALLPTPGRQAPAAPDNHGPCIAIEPTTPEAAMADKRHCIAIIPNNPDATITDTGFSIVPTTPDAALRDVSRCFAIIPTAPELPLALQKTVLAIVPAAQEDQAGASSSSMVASSSSKPGLDIEAAEKALVTVLPSPSSSAFPSKDKHKFLLPPETQDEQTLQVLAHLIKVGLTERAKVVLDHIQHHHQQVLALGIVGEGGLGKTAILMEVLTNLRKRSEFVVAYGETTISPSREALAETISTMAHQLGADSREVFCTTLEARQALSKQAHQIKTLNQQKICLAIDNIWSSAALREMLPRNLGHVLPTGSLILITSPSDAVAKVLDELTRPQHPGPASPYAFWCYHPEHLSPPEAKEMFMLHASKRGVQLFPEHEDLVDELVPLCGGLPLVLQVVGSHFARFARRKREDWAAVSRKMKLSQEFQLREDEICSKLKVIYEGLDPVLQDAFLEAAMFLRGTSWKLVERILGKHHLASLADQAFVFSKPKEHVPNWSASDSIPVCRQSLRLNMDVLDMHDLVYSLGHQLGKGHYITCTDVQRLPEVLQDRAEAGTIKGLTVKRCQEAFPLAAIDKMRKLHVLIFEGTNTTGHCHRPPHHLRCLVWHPLDQGKERSSMPFKLKRLNKLVVAHLHNVRSDFSDIEFPPKLVELELDNCVKLVDLPRSIGNLKWLHSLHMHNCHSLRGLPEAIGGLVMLQELVLSVCTSITELPQSIGNLHDLEYLDLAACFKLMALPKTIAKLRSLKVLDLTGCESLTTLPTEIGELQNLKELVLAGCGSLKELPAEIGSLMHLTVLDVSHCEQLSALPQQIGNLVALRELNVMWCEKLSFLPPQVGFLVALTELELSDCRSLPEIPVTIGNLNALRRLHLRGCSQLRVLPPEIGNLKNISSLDLRGCVNLTSLPSPEIAKLRPLAFLGIECAAAPQLWPHLHHLSALKRLDIDDKTGSCTSVPAAIWSLATLEKLALRGFRKATSFAQEKWNLPLLSSLWMEGFTNVTALPAQLSTLTSVSFLVLAEFASLTELPVGIGHLSKLERLSLRCNKLKSLAPEMFRGLTKLRCLSLAECVSLVSLSIPRGSLASLEILDLVGCTSLTELPVALVGMNSLERLNCRECTALKVLPPEIGELSKLQSLYLQQCSTLRDLPPQIGRLSILERLDMKKCAGLTRLPAEIGMLSKLKYLLLSGSTALKQLPPQIGELKGLVELALEGCTSLRELPAQIGDLRSLENLGLDACAGLVGLPSEIGKVESLKRLSLLGCSGLKSLPKELSRLPKLRLLRLDGCTSLVELPSEIGNLQSLVNLGLEGCTSLASYPPGILKLPNLELLDLRRCPVGEELNHEASKYGCTIVRNDLDWEGFEEVWLYY